MDAEIFDLASLFGKEENREMLKAFNEMLSSKECDPVLRLAGLKILRTLLYINPAKLNKTEQEREYLKFIQNLPPSDGSNLHERFVTFQKEMVELGCVDVVFYCLSGKCKDTDIIKAALQLAVTLIEGGNIDIQDTFAQKFEDSEEVLTQLHAIITEATFSIRQAKRIRKQEKILEKLSTDVGSNDGQSLDRNFHTSLMSEVFKWFRRLYMGDHTRMQDLLRSQASSLCFIHE
jgi:hypothetical protein